MISAGVPLSDTLSSKDQTPIADKTPVDIDGLSPRAHENELPRLLYELAPGISWSHWQLYPDVPPANDVVVESDADCPTSSTGGVVEMVGAESAGFTIMVTGLEVLVTGDAALSVTCSSKDQDPDTERAPVSMDVGDEQAEELPSRL